MTWTARLAAGLVFGILLHALLMAVSVDAAMPAHAAPAEHPASPHHQFCADYTNRCFTVRDVARRSVTHVPVVGPLPLPSNHAVDEAVELPAAVLPYHPPDVLRALLQVYRI